MSEPKTFQELENHRIELEDDVRRLTQDLARLKEENEKLSKHFVSKTEFDDQEIQIKALKESVRECIKQLSDEFVGSEECWPPQVVSFLKTIRERHEWLK
jgi:predicted  nucleic acid-binding Zn-ribbon protein